MSILPQLEKDLLRAAQSRISADERAERRRPASTLGERLRARRWRLPLLVAVCLLASTTIGLAANGVILTGNPVKVSGPSSPHVGVGVPQPGGSRLLPLRVADPEGGPPWGMRVVHTTRGEVCMQIGRVVHGRLGELGIDGAFHDDGRFHPLPAGALPVVEADGTQSRPDANTTCVPPGRAISAAQRGIDRSASGSEPAAGTSRGDLRDVGFGLLGPRAVSVTYRDGSRRRTQQVVPEIGAYLLVQRAKRDPGDVTSSASVGTYGGLQPGGMLSRIAYRIDGRVCRRGPVVAAGTSAHIAHRCPTLHTRGSGGPPAPTPDLHRSVHAHLEVRGHAVRSVEVSFAAPFAIDSGSHEYAAWVRVKPCQPHGGQAYIGRSLDRNVARGATVRFRFHNPFAEVCGRRSVTIEAVYERSEGGGHVLVGSVTVHEPPGIVTPAPPAVRVPWPRG